MSAEEDKNLPIGGEMTEDRDLDLESVMSGEESAAGQKKDHIEIETGTKTVSEIVVEIADRIETERKLVEETATGARAESGIGAQKVCIYYHVIRDSIEAY